MIVITFISIITIISFYLLKSVIKKSESEEINVNSKIANWNIKTQEEQLNLNSAFNNGKIAPGTEGSFNINIDATTTDVNIEYKIQFLNETEKPHNLKFKYNDIVFDTLKELEECLTGVIEINDSDRVKNIRIFWEWKYETGNNLEEITKNDQIDTEDMKKITDYSFQIHVNSTQI